MEPPEWQALVRRSADLRARSADAREKSAEVLAASTRIVTRTAVLRDMNARNAQQITELADTIRAYLQRDQDPR